jgi:formylglycine-generating enzyme required for sulfatase activity
MDSRFKLVFLVAVLGLTGIPLIGILNGSDPPPVDPEGPNLLQTSSLPPSNVASSDSQIPVKDTMVFIPAGEFIQGTNEGGYNEGPERTVYLDGFWIDQYEVTNHQYQQFVEATGHRKPGPPSRYAKRLAQLRGVNQPVTYVSWQDADTYCKWKGKRLPIESEWEKAVRGIDGRFWPWGNYLEKRSANFGGSSDRFESTAPIGSFIKDKSVFGVYDGAGNLMEWVADWYEERPGGGYPTKVKEQKEAADYGSYKVLRGLGYTNRGIDLRITNRSFMIPNFRDETIGFRCASSRKIPAKNQVAGSIVK